MPRHTPAPGISWLPDKPGYLSLQSCPFTVPGIAWLPNESGYLSLHVSPYNTCKNQNSLDSLEQVLNTTRLPPNLPSQGLKRRSPCSQQFSTFHIEKKKKKKSGVWKNGSVQEHLLLIQRNQVWFPTPISGRSQPPATLILGDPMSSFDLCACK